MFVHGWPSGTLSKRWSGNDMDASYPAAKAVSQGVTAGTHACAFPH